MDFSVQQLGPTVKYFPWSQRSERLILIAIQGHLCGYKLPDLGEFNYSIPSVKVVICSPHTPYALRKKYLRMSSKSQNLIVIDINSTQFALVVIK